MLSPHDRSSLFAGLRPPPGFVLDAAVGTSFTLDLEALLTAPIAFALFEDQDATSDGSGIEPVGLLESIRRYAGRITMFCQAGQIALPSHHRAIFAWLEENVVEAIAPRAGFLFHPKVWLARYREAGSDRRLLRVLCATRNLTFDTSWDTLLLLESEAYEERGRTVREHADLAAFFRGLPSLGLRPLPPERRATIEDLAADLGAVRLLAPPPFEAVSFHVLGADRRATRSCFPEGSTRAVVVSPFLSDEFLERFTADHDLAVLVSREESLDRIRPELLRRVGRLAVLNSAVELAVPESEADTTASAAGDPGRSFGGLHAKLFVFDAGDRAVVLTGSANATGAAFSGNVEVVAELRGPAAAGIAALLADTPGEVGLDDLLVDYTPLASPVEPTPQQELERRLDGFRRALAGCSYQAKVEEDGDHYRLRIAGDQPVPPADAGDDLAIRLWPITLAEDQSASPLVPGELPAAEFAVTLQGITAFFGVRLTARSGTGRATTSFLVHAALDGAPEDRHSRLLAVLLSDPDRLLRYLVLLLADSEQLAGDVATGGGAPWVGRWAGAAWDAVPLLELLVRAVDRFPDRLDHIDRLLQDLGVQREAILPDQWDSIWAPIWAFRQAVTR